MSESVVRVECTSPGLEDTWIELPDRGWTLAELDKINSTAFKPAGAVELLQRYAIACHLQIMESMIDVPEEAGPAPEGPITRPADLTENILRYYMDARLLNFLVGAVYEGGRHTLQLAPFAVRASLKPADQAAAH